MAKLAGLYPEDPIQAAFADQAVFLVQDVWDVSAGVRRRYMHVPISAVWAIQQGA